MRVKPADEVGGLSVDTWVAGLSTSVSPRDNTGKLASAHEWATRVSLAGVLTSLLKTGTDHRVSDFRNSIGITAVIIADNWDSDLNTQCLLQVKVSSIDSPS